MNHKKKRGRTILMLRFAAGVYLVYSTCTLAKHLLNNSVPARWTLLGWVLAAIFGLFGFFLIFDSCRTYYAVPPEDESAIPEPPAFILDEALTGDNDPTPLFAGLARCVTDHRDICASFNEFSYASGFSQYADSCREAILRAGNAVTKSGQPELFLQTLCDHLIYDLKLDYESCTSRKEKTARMNADKKTLTFYMIPLIQELAFPAGSDLANGICGTWNTAFPSFAFRVGTYLEILSGFAGRSPLRHFGYKK